MAGKAVSKLFRSASITIWGDQKVKKLMVANVKADLRTRRARYDQRAGTESGNPGAPAERETYYDLQRGSRHPF